MKTIGKALRVGVVTSFAATLGNSLAIDVLNTLVPAAGAAGGVVTDPAGVAPDRYVYYPGTEALSKRKSG